MTNLHGQKLKTVLYMFGEVGLCGRTNRINNTPLNKSKLVHISTYLNTLMLLLQFLLICRYRKEEEETMCDRSSPIMMNCDAMTNFLIEPFSFTIAYVDPGIAGKRVGENDPEQFLRH
jgi:hypothetical protein